VEREITRESDFNLKFKCIGTGPQTTHMDGNISGRMSTLDGSEKILLKKR